MVLSKSRSSTAMLIVVSLGALLIGPELTAADPSWQAGLAKRDITPSGPMRLSGYANRSEPSSEVHSQLFVRCLALKPSDSSEPFFLISVDTIGLSGELTTRIAGKLKAEHGCPRENVVFCSTHSHTTPDLNAQLRNIFTVPLTEPELLAADRYREHLEHEIIASASDAMQVVTPVKIRTGQTTVGFAANRRVVSQGAWTGFGVQAAAPTDHAVPFLVIENDQQATIGIVFNYACHCTTLTGNDNGVSGDWAGYASQRLEELYPEAVALCTIGCGGDQNPEPRGSLAFAQRHGYDLAAAIKAADATKELAATLEANFDYAALAFSLPDQETVEQNLNSANIHQRRLAEELAGIWKEAGRLPATYPVPVQTWKLGELQMVFLGGEVVVDYALRLKQELNDPSLWVTAYANDVLGYIASERMRAEGGYEYDGSAVYYSLPGPWESGTEDLLVERTKAILNRTPIRPLDPQTALKTMEFSDEFDLQIVASEPLVQDPINIAFGADGRLWVVEMGDYPEGDDAPDFEVNPVIPEEMRGVGRIKILFDDDGNGVYDRAINFLDGLAFPTGVFPWHEGVLVSAAPQILYARDTDGDNRCDDLRTLVDGLPLSNPQHRINGFTYGLDHSVHCAAGDDLGEIINASTGETIDARGADLQLWPDTGKVAIVSGRSQYIRSRDDWGNWFGSDNSRPGFHYVIDRSVVDSLPYNVSVEPQQIFEPAVAPPVFPTQQTHERFNDLFAANRFTSACSTIILRSNCLGEKLRGGVVVCEPVHNLVHYSRLVPQDATFTTERPALFAESELLRSSDPWFRPVRACVGPDDALWVVDMYRQVIEHPEWIPIAWQERLDLRAGHDRGRIYRLAKKSARSSSRWKPLHESNMDALIEMLNDSNGTVRDMVQQELLSRPNDDLERKVRDFLTHCSSAGAVHGLSILDNLGSLKPADLTVGMRIEIDANLVTFSVSLAHRFADDEQVIASLLKLTEHPSSAVRLRAIIALRDVHGPQIGASLWQHVQEVDMSNWEQRAVEIATAQHWRTMLDKALAEKTMPPGKLDHRTRSELYQVIWTAASAAGFEIDDSLLGRLDGADYGELLSYTLLQVNKRRPFAADAPERLEQLRSASVQQLAEKMREAEDVEQRVELLMRLATLGAAQDDLAELIFSQIDVSVAVEVQVAAVDAASRIGVTQFADAMIERWDSITPSVRESVVSSLVSREAWSQTLLNAIANAQVRATDIPLAVQSQLQSSNNAKIRSVAIDLFTSETNSSKRELIDRYLVELERLSEGNLEQGRTLFAKHCAACHQPDAEGNLVGANLFNLSSYSDATLVESVLDPNKAVDPKYRAMIVQTQDDRVMTGVVQAETSAGLTLMLSDGKRETFNRAEIAAVKDLGVSLMPEKFETLLDAAAMRDILTFLKAH